MHKFFLEFFKKNKNKIYFFILILIVAVTIFYRFNISKTKQFSDLYVISEEVVSGKIFSVDIENYDLDRIQANKILDALNKNQYSYYGRKQAVIPGSLYHITLKSVSENYDITISDQNLLITSDIIYKISGNENFVELIKNIKNIDR